MGQPYLRIKLGRELINTTVDGLPESALEHFRDVPKAVISADGRH